ETGRALLGTDREALEVGQTRDRAAFFDQDRLFGEVVRIGESDDLFAFRGDRRCRHHRFELALRDVTEDRFEGGVDEFLFAADLGADRFYQFDVEAGVTAVLRFLLERGVGDVGSDGQLFAAACRFFTAFGCGTAAGAFAAFFARAARAGAAAPTATGHDKRGDRQQERREERGGTDLGHTNCASVRIGTT